MNWAPDRHEYMMPGWEDVADRDALYCYRCDALIEDENEAAVMGTDDERGAVVLCPDCEAIVEASRAAGRAATR